MAVKTLFGVVEHAAAAADEIERLFADERHWEEASATCRAYFTTVCAGSSVMAQLKRVLDDAAGGTGRSDSGRYRPKDRGPNQAPVGVPDTPA